jgi:putative sterol carrier protein
LATHEEITESLQAFQENYLANAKLVAMNKDWNRIVLVLANDVESTHTLVLEDGHLTLHQGRQGEPDLTVIADSETLADMFFGEITPTEPYLDGTLKIKGSEDDITRLDFITLLIWGE